MDHSLISNCNIFRYCFINFKLMYFSHFKSENRMCLPSIACHSLVCMWHIQCYVFIWTLPPWNHTPQPTIWGGGKRQCEPHCASLYRKGLLPEGSPFPEAQLEWALLLRDPLAEVGHGSRMKGTKLSVLAETGDWLWPDLSWRDLANLWCGSSILDALFPSPKWCLWPRSGFLRIRGLWN